MCSYVYFHSHILFYIRFYVLQAYEIKKYSNMGHRLSLTPKEYSSTGSNDVLPSVIPTSPLSNCTANLPRWGYFTDVDYKLWNII